MKNIVLSLPLISGLALVLAAKMLGTAALARLFALTQPALMRLQWFARLYGRWKPWKDALIAQVKGSLPWRSAQAALRALVLRHRQAIATSLHRVVHHSAGKR